MVGQHPVCSVLLHTRILLPKIVSWFSLAVDQLYPHTTLESRIQSGIILNIYQHVIKTCKMTTGSIRTQIIFGFGMQQGIGVACMLKHMDMPHYTQASLFFENDSSINSLH